MPKLSTQNLKSEKELFRAHLLLSLMAHSYIIGFPKMDSIESVLPECIAVPWFQISAVLGLNPVVSYETLELHNFKLLNNDLPPSLHNLAMLHTFSGSFDEAWFYLIPLAIEITGAPAVKALLDALSDFETGKTDQISDYLTIMKEHINEMAQILKHMYDRNDPHVFWHRVRPYSGKSFLVILGGSKNNSLLPTGLFFEGVTEIDEYCSLGYESPPGKVGTWRSYAGIICQTLKL
jgi:indoleamine 2,3-dioxygenase